MQPVTGSWEGWKAQLAEAVQLGRSMEMSTEQNGRACPGRRFSGARCHSEAPSKKC